MSNQEEKNAIVSVESCSSSSPTLSSGMMSRAFIRSFFKFSKALWWIANVL